MYLLCYAILPENGRGRVSFEILKAVHSTGNTSNHRCSVVLQNKFQYNAASPTQSKVLSP